jgi:hypothetical protein
LYENSLRISVGSTIRRVSLLADRAPSLRTASATDASSVSSSMFRLSLFSVYVGLMSSSTARTIDESFVSPEACIP